MTIPRIALALSILCLVSASLTASTRAAREPSAADLEKAGLDGAATPPSAPAFVPTGIVVPALLVALEGDGGGGSTISSLNAPFTNGDGMVGFTGGLANGDEFVWFDDGITWLNSDETGQVLNGAESTMGVSDAGGFIYSPSADGHDAVWTDGGLLLQDETQAPGFPAGTTSTFHSRPTMGPSGRAYWISGFDESGGSTTDGRMLYTSPDGTAGSTSVVLRSDDVIDSFTIDRPSGVDFDYDFSDDESHHIHVLLMDTGSTADDGFVYVDGSLVARESEPSGDGDNWGSFDAVAINSSGHYLFAGDTDGATAGDEFIAYDGSITLREGDTIGGIELTSASVQALSLADTGVAVHTWNTSTTEALFVACSADDLAGSRLLLQVGDALDLDDNGTADATVTDLNASGVIGPGLDLSDSGFVFVEVDVDSGTGELEAIVRLELGCEVFADGFESGDTSAWSNTVP